jgi:hypothetical protein
VKVFVDDDPIRDSWVDDSWIIVRNYDEAMELLNEGLVDELSLDHDLGLQSRTGYAIAAKIEEWAAGGYWFHVPEKITIHSANIVGRKNIQAAIDSIEGMRYVRQRQNDR